jgi:LacI family transcriptional regulator
MQSGSRARFGSDVTIDDVARAVGVSARTVSRVLNKSPNVDPDTRANIEAAIARLGFSLSLRARGLATGRSYMIGLLHNEHNALVLGEAQSGTAREAARRGYELVVHPTPLDADDPIANVLDFVKRSRVDGLLIMAPVSGMPGLPETLSKVGVVSCALSAIDIAGFTHTFVYDERGGAALAAQHLIDLGHRRIAMVSGPNLISGVERRVGFVEGLKAAGLELIGDEGGDYSFDSGLAAGNRLLQLRLPPTAIFAANDIMAAGVLRAAAERGIAVPSQLSVIGFDGSILARTLTPSLTSVDRPMGLIVEAAVARLIDAIEGVESEPVAAPMLTLLPGASTAFAPS